MVEEVAKKEDKRGEGESWKKRSDGMKKIL